MYKTEQENFWAGEFGNEYIDRNNDSKLLSQKVSTFKKISENLTNIDSVIEFGSNIGLNLKAIKTIFPDIKLNAIEINKKACKYLGKEHINCFNESILEFNKNDSFDLVIIFGVLMHINPEELDMVYEKLYKASNKYICIKEYYNPTPETIKYRGYENKLFKRDFAGEMMDKYPDLKLISYRFEYHRDTNFEQDDGTWFLMEKTNG